MKSTIKTTFYSLFFLSGAVAFQSCEAQTHGPEIQAETNKNYTYTTLVDSIAIPWGMAFLPNNELLVTEKSGTLYRIKDQQKTIVEGLPPVYVRGQGGLLDVAVSPDYDQTQFIYITLSSPLGEEKGGHTALYRAKLIDNRLENVSLLYKGKGNTKKGQHWGSRIAFDNEGHLFFSIGDRGNREVNPQNTSRDGGKIYRLNRDGSIPNDNPFTDNMGNPSAIYSYGHRNPQGMLTHPKTGQIWTHEHGPKGGDEINIIKKGKNYGWPVITYGINYSGTPITDQNQKEGMEQPLYYWVPSIAPSGMAFSTSEIYPEWKNQLFVGSLKFQYLERLVLKENKVIERHKVLDSIGRVRNVKQGPDGYLYVGVEGKGILKIIPEKRP